MIINIGNKVIIGNSVLKLNSVELATRISNGFIQDINRHENKIVANAKRYLGYPYVFASGKTTNISYLVTLLKRKK